MPRIQKLPKLVSLRAFVRRNRLLVRTLVAMVLICSVLLSALSALLYLTYSRIGREDVHAVSGAMLEQAYRSADRQLLAIYGYFATLYRKDPLLFEARYSPEFTPDSMYEIGQKLRTYVEVNPLVKSVYVYDLAARTVFSSETSAQRIDGFFDEDMMKRLADPAAQPYPIFIPRTVRYRVYDKWEDQSFITIVYSEQPGPEGAEAALVVNIDRNELLRMLSWELPGGSGRFIVSDREGRMIIHPEGMDFSESISGEAFFRQIKASGSDGGWFTARIGGHRRYVSYFRSSPALGWFFISLLEYDQLVEGIRRLRNIVLLSTGGFILLAGIVSFLLSRTIYRPFQDFLQRVRVTKGQAHESESLGEIDYLGKVIDGLSSDVSELMGKLDATRSVRRREQLLRLLRGEAFQDAATEGGAVVEALAFDPRNGPFVACAIRMDDFQALSQRCSARELSMLRVAISDLAAEELRVEYPIEAFETSEDGICILFGSSSDGSQPVELGNNLGKLRDSIKGLLGISVTIGIGEVADSASDIPSSWEQALAAADHRFIRGTGLVISHDPAVANPLDRPYPTSLERQLLDALKLEDAEAFTGSVDRFLAELRDLPYERIMLFLTQLALALQRTVTEGFRLQGEPVGLSWRSIGTRLGGFDTIDQVRDWLIAVGTDVTATMARRKEGKREQTVERVLQSIAENYANLNLSVDLLAGEVGLSVNHLRVVFKESTGESISDHLSRVRFDHAKRLLRTTDLPAKRVAEMVGYANHNYFYISFKKATGLSPETWRKEPPPVEGEDGKKGRE